MKRSNERARALLRNGLELSTIKEGERDALSSLDSQHELAHYLEENIPTQQYTRRRELGRGGMGAVFEVWDPTIERTLAMKILHQRDGEGTKSAPNSSVARFLKEAQITGQINHPGVAPVHEIAADENGRLFFTMQVVEGLSLQEILDMSETERSREGWTPTRLINILLKVCDTIAYAHSKNIIHRDLKPANVMIGQFGETYVMDWGLAKRVGGEMDEGIMTLSEGSPDSEDPNKTRFVPGTADTTSPTLALTMEGSVLGTPMYMPPEQAAGLVDELGFACDIYAVGAILYHILAGHPPFADRGFPTAAKLIQAVRAESPTPIHHSDNLMSSGELVAICEKAMARDIDRRYENMLAMSRDLRAYLEDRVVTAYQSGALAELKKWVVRNRGIAIATALTVLVAIIGVGAVVLTQAKSNSDLSLLNEQIEDEQDRTKLALEKEQEAHRLSRSLGLANESTRILRDNPAGALLVALEAAKRAPNHQANTAIYQALDQSREIQVFESRADAYATLSKDGKKLASLTTDHHIAISDVETGRRLALLVGHTKAIHDIQFNDTGDNLISISEDRMAGIWDVKEGRLIRWLTEPGEQETHEIQGSRVTYSHGCEFIATAGAMGDVKVWESATGKLVNKHGRPPGENRIRTIAFSPDGKKLLTGSIDGNVRLWEWSSDVDPVALVTSGEGSPLHRGGLSYVEFSKSGGHFLTVARLNIKITQDDRPSSTEDTCYIWDSTGKLHQALRHPGAAVVTAARFTPDGKQVVTGAGDGKLRIWSVESGEMESEPITFPVSKVQSIDISRDGQFILAGGSDKIARVTDAATGALVCELEGHEDEIDFVGFVPGENEVMTCARDDTARIWRVHGQAPLATLNDGMPVLAADLDPLRPGRAATLSFDPPRIRVWDGRARSEVFQIQISPDTDRVFYTADGKHLVSITPDWEVNQWSAETGDPVRATDLGFDDGKYFGRTPDGQFLLASSRDRKVVKRLDLHGGEVSQLSWDSGLSIDFSSDGQRIVHRDGGTFHIREFGKPEPIASLELGATVSVSFSPAGRLLSWGHQVTKPKPGGGHDVRFPMRLTDLDTEVAVTLDGHRHPFICHGFSTGSDRLVTGSQDQTAFLWDTTNGSVIRKFSTQRFPINRCSISNDGKLVITFSNQELSPRLWNAETGKSWILTRRDYAIREAVFSPQNNLVATTARTDSRVALWTPDGELLALLPGDEDEQIAELQFSSDESWLLTRSESGFARLWPTDIQTFASSGLPRDLTPHEREVYQISTPDELREIEGNLTIRRELETLRLMGQALGTSIPSAQVVRTHRFAASRIAAADTTDQELLALAADELAGTLYTLGKGDPQSHLHVANALFNLGAEEAARKAVRRALAFTKINPRVKTALEDLQKTMAEPAN